MDFDMEGQKRKVLICDDSKLARKKLKDLLEGMACEVSEAENGTEAVAVYKSIRPELVFMDIIMPETDGLEALQLIKAIDGEARVVMLTSTGTSSKLIQALKCGACDFIQKPFKPEQIAKAVGVAG